jgi:hypothetical protein
MTERYLKEQLGAHEISERHKGYTSWPETNLDHIGFNHGNIRDRVGVEAVAAMRNNACDGGPDDVQPPEQREPLHAQSLQHGRGARGPAGNL